jgi:uncharacterized protein (DUF885 family)
MQRIPLQLALQNVPRPEDSPFYAPFLRFPDSIDVATVGGSRPLAVMPSPRRCCPLTRASPKPLRSAIYRPRATPFGIFDTPDGADFYRERIAYHTTSEKLSADEIHRIGLAEVERIRTEMLAIKDRVGFKGTLKEFFVFLRTDPQFYYKTPQELLEGYRDITRRIDPNLPRVFSTLPKTPYGVRPIPATSAPNTTTAYYQGPATDGSRPGYYYVQSRFGPKCARNTRWKC